MKSKDEGIRGWLSHIFIVYCRIYASSELSSEVTDKRPSELFLVFISVMTVLNASKCLKITRLLSKSSIPFVLSSRTSFRIIVL